MDQHSEPTTSPQEDTIFDEASLVDLKEYKKRIRQARNAIYAVAAIQFIAGLYVGLTGPDNMLWLMIGIYSLVAFIFLALASWAAKKPYAALLTALIIYGSLILLDIAYDPSSLLKGILVKIAIIVYLIKGISNAREVGQMRKTLGMK